MIAPEGIRDGRYYAEALYTFAGEGVEDLPFKKGKNSRVLTQPVAHSYSKLTVPVLIRAYPID
ncbi:hypothetical protein GGF41_008418, partial [Coemansia sp. RSA 2531]